MLRLHLCCGPQKKEGWTNIDRGNFGQEIVADVNQKWTFVKPGTADHILIEDGLEHLDSVENFLSQSARALKTGGILEIKVPHFKNPSAYRVSHKHFFSHSLFHIFPEAHDSVQNLRVKSIRLIVDNRFPLSLLNVPANLFPSVWERTAYVSGLHVIMEKTDHT